MKTVLIVAGVALLVVAGIVIYVVHGFVRSGIWYEP